MNFDYKDQPCLYVATIVCMPFGLVNAVQTLQQFIDQVLYGLIFSYAYLDDVLVASKDTDKYLQHLRVVF